MTAIDTNKIPTGADLLAMSGPDAEQALSSLSFKRQLDCILQVPWKERMSVIMQSPSARELVQALPAEEVFWMVKQRGIGDSLPLIARTSHEQFQYLIDLDCWQHDQLVPEACLDWYRMLGRCNQAKVLEWFEQADDCLVVSGLKQFIHVHKIEEESDISEEYDAMPPCTIDGINFFRFESEDAQLVLLPLLRVLLSHDAGRYQSVIEGIIWDPRAESEDEALHWRQNRVAENGFPPFDEALGLYGPLSEDELQKFAPLSSVPVQTTAPGHASVARVRYALEESRLPDFLRAVLGASDVYANRDSFEQQFITTANKIIVADCLEVRDIEDVRRALRKTAGYISIALEYLSAGDFDAAPALLVRHHPQLLFRYGAHLVNSLAARMRRHKGHIWTSDTSRFTCFYGTPLADTGLGLVRSRPLFYEGLVSNGSSLYRDFESRFDLETASAAVDRLIAADRLLFERAGLNIAELAEAYVKNRIVTDPAEITMPALLSTLLIAHSLNLDTLLPLLTISDVQTFADHLSEIEGDAGAGLALFCDQACAWADGEMAGAAGDTGTFAGLIRDSLEPLADMLTMIRKGSADLRYVSSVLFKRS